MFRITESEKPKFLLGCVVFSACAKQRRRQQRMAGNTTLLRSTSNFPRFSQDGFYSALLPHQHAVVQMHDAVGAGGQLQVVRHHDQAGAL